MALNFSVINDYQGQQPSAVYMQVWHQENDLNICQNCVKIGLHYILYWTKSASPKWHWCPHYHSKNKQRNCYQNSAILTRERMRIREIYATLRHSVRYREEWDGETSVKMPPLSSIKTVDICYLKSNSKLSRKFISRWNFWRLLLLKVICNIPVLISVSTV